MDKKILAIDTSGLQACAAIVDGYITIGEIALNARTGEKSWTHSEILMPAIDQLFALTGVSRHNIDYVAYTNGPGSFTGLRIGASVALGLAKGLNKPTIAVPTLDALAYNMFGMGNESFAKAVVVPLMDARRSQVYTALYTFDGGCINRITEYLAMPILDVVAAVKDYSHVYLLGDGACAYKQEIVEALPQGIFLPQNNNRQRASSLALCGANMLVNGYVPSSEVDIIYVRAPQAVQDLKDKQKKL